MDRAGRTWGLMDRGGGGTWGQTATLWHQRTAAVCLSTCTCTCTCSIPEHAVAGTTLKAQPGLPGTSAPRPGATAGKGGASAPLPASKAAASAPLLPGPASKAAASAPPVPGPASKLAACTAKDKAPPMTGKDRLEAQYNSRKVVVLSSSEIPGPPKKWHVQQAPSVPKVNGAGAGAGALREQASLPSPASPSSIKAIAAAGGRAGGLGSALVSHRSCPLPLSPSGQGGVRAQQASPAPASPLGAAPPGSVKSTSSAAAATRLNSGQGGQGGLASPARARALAQSGSIKSREFDDSPPSGQARSTAALGADHQARSTAAPGADHHVSASAPGSVQAAPAPPPARLFSCSSPQSVTCRRPPGASPAKQLAWRTGLGAEAGGGRGVAGSPAGKPLAAVRSCSNLGSALVIAGPDPTCSSVAQGDHESYQQGGCQDDQQKGQEDVGLKGLKARGQGLPFFRRTVLAGVGAAMPDGSSSPLPHAGTPDSLKACKGKRKARGYYEELDDLGNIREGRHGGGWEEGSVEGAAGCSFWAMETPAGDAGAAKAKISLPPLLKCGITSSKQLLPLLCQCAAPSAAPEVPSAVAGGMDVGVCPLKRPGDLGSGGCTGAKRRRPELKLEVKQEREHKSVSGPGLQASNSSPQQKVEPALPEQQQQKAAAPTPQASPLLNQQQQQQEAAAPTPLASQLPKQQQQQQQRHPLGLSPEGLAQVMLGERAPILTGWPSDLLQELSGCSVVEPGDEVHVFGGGGHEGKGGRLFLVFCLTLRCHDLW